MALMRKPLAERVQMASPITIDRSMASPPDPYWIGGAASTAVTVVALHAAGSHGIGVGTGPGSGEG